MIRAVEHAMRDGTWKRSPMAQLLLRHESLSTTQAYLHPTKRDLAETLRALDAAWGKG